MKILMLVHRVDIKALVSGDKSARITLEALNPRDLPELAKLSDVLEVWVDFQINNIDTKQEKE